MTPDQSIMSYEEVCRELDVVVVELMGSLQKIAEARLKYGAAVREGYFNMSKARYAMGPQSVSALQYDGMMTPLVHVEVCQEDPPCEEDELSYEFKIERPHQSAVHRSESGDQATTGGAREALLRRRKPPSVENSGQTEETKDTEGARDGVLEGEEPKDPLKWFGILVPQALRQSQQNFVQAIIVCGELANAQAQVESLRKKFHKLSLKKQQLKVQVT